MMNEEEVEALLGSVPKPQLIPGHHRSDLKARLIGMARNRSAGLKTSKWRWAAAASLATLVAAGVGWAAQKWYSGVFVVEQWEVEHWQEPAQTVVNPDGSMTASGKSHRVVGGVVSGRFVGSRVIRQEGDEQTVVSETGPQLDLQYSQEEADRHWQEVRKAIDNGNFKLIEVKQTPNGPLYSYEVTLEDGSTQPLRWHFRVEQLPKRQ
jgi:hypothetical protein